MPKPEGMDAPSLPAWATGFCEHCHRPQDPGCEGPCRPRVSLLPNVPGAIRRHNDGRVAVRFKYAWYVVGTPHAETTTAIDAEVADWPLIFHPGAVFALVGGSVGEVHP